MAISGEESPLNPRNFNFIPEDLSDYESVVFGGAHFQDFERKQLEGLYLPVSRFGYKSLPHDLPNVDLVDVDLDDVLVSLNQTDNNEMGIFLMGVERGLSVRGNAFQRHWMIGFLAVSGRIVEKEDPA